MLRRDAFLLLLLALFTWKLVRTDWIVSTRYWFYDSDPPPTESITIRTFTPPVSPAWRPPQPRDFDSTATTWRHPHFFEIGGAWGPTEEPRLHVNWTLLLIKLACAAIAGGVAIVLTYKARPALLPSAGFMSSRAKLIYSAAGVTISHFLATWFVTLQAWEHEWAASLMKDMLFPARLTGLGGGKLSIILLMFFNSALWGLVFAALIALAFRSFRRSKARQLSKPTAGGMTDR